jgi:predicted RNA-binding protein YlxR (DUF448 family)
VVVVGSIFDSDKKKIEMQQPLYVKITEKGPGPEGTEEVRGCYIKERGSCSWSEQEKNSFREQSNILKFNIGGAQLARFNFEWKGKPQGPLLPCDAEKARVAKWKNRYA